MLDICLLGTSGMLPLPGRWLTAMMAKYNGKSLLIDCGEGTQIAIKEKGWSFNPIGIICITHYHADHVSGLAGLLLTIGNSERKEPITIIGPKGLERVVNALRVIAPELPFELRFIELTKQEEEIEIDGFNIKAFKVNHAVVCYGYTITIKRLGKFDAAKANKLQIPVKYWNKLQHGSTVVSEEGIEYTPDMVMGKERKGIKITYCTDTRPVQSLINNARESDLLICEGMYGEKGREAKAKEYKHMTFTEAANVASQAQVKELWLTHFSPLLTKPSEYLENVTDIFKNAYVGKDGKSRTFDFEDEDSKEKRLL